MKRHLIFSLAVLVTLIGATNAMALQGAIQTTNSSCGAVNDNRFLWKTDVYVQGGPNNDSAQGLEDGNYWVKVTEPDGTLLGLSPSATVTVSGGSFPCYQLWSLVNKASNPLDPGYDSTTNGGGEYKVWVSTTPTFDGGTNKTDNFKVDEPQISVAKTCPSDVFVGDTISYTVTVTNTGGIALTNVQVIDSMFGALALPDEYDDTLAKGASYTWTLTAPATDAGTVVNLVSASGLDDYFDYTATAASQCSTNVWALEVSKTAATSYTRDWQWTLNKTADNPGPVNISMGNNAPITFTITATPTAVDSDWAVSGSVTVHNPAPMSATVNSVSDALSDNTSVALSCPGSAPYTIAGGGDLVCTYSVSLSGPNDGTNNAAATLQNNDDGTTDFSGSADYAFGDPTTVLHACATISDSGATVANGDGSGSTGWSLAGGSATYNACAPNGGSFTYSATLTNVSVGCDIKATVSNSATLSDGDNSQSSSASTAVYTGVCPSGCTATIGYWKTHAGFTGNNADRVTQYLPQYLGNVGGPKTVTVISAPQAVLLLQMSGDASNGINKLYAQMLGAKLNIAKGASPVAVAATITAADNFLANKNSGDWNGLSKTVKNQVIGWMSAFDAYNNGLIGPGHCN